MKTNRNYSCLLLACCLLSSFMLVTESFVIPNNRPKSLSSTTELGAFWRHWVPKVDFLEQSDGSSSYTDSLISTSIDDVTDNARNLGLGSILAAMLVLAIPSAGIAVSGGGLDFANLDITGQDFSNQNYKGKDFTQVIAKGTNFAKSNLQGCRFYKAYLVNADFSGSDLRGASLEDTSMDGASLKGALAAGSYFSNSILDAETVEDADFTDAQFPLKVIPLLCMRDDLKGTNPVTGVDTRDSAMCP